MKKLFPFALVVAMAILMFIPACGGGGGGGGGGGSPDLEATYTFDSADTPLHVEENWPTGVVSEINVSGFVGSISKVTVQVNISHPFDWDMWIYLTSPSNREIILSSRNPSGPYSLPEWGEDYRNTIFDDDAYTFIEDGSAPFRGSYIPEEGLWKFNGEDPNGTWRLTVKDDQDEDDGTLLYWRLGLD
jgi:hypothetical protein